jgi:hypothetical protein
MKQHYEEDERAIKLRQVWIKNAPIDFYRKLAKDDDYLVRKHLAQNMTLPEEVFEAFSAEKNPDVLFYLCRHPKIPLPLLEKLATLNMGCLQQAAHNPKSSEVIKRTYLLKMSQRND